MNELVIRFLLTVGGAIAGAVIKHLADRYARRTQIIKDAKEAISIWVTQIEEIVPRGNGKTNDQFFDLHKASIPALRATLVRAFDALDYNQKNKAKDLWKKYCSIRPQYMAEHLFEETTLREAMADHMKQEREPRPTSGRDLMIDTLHEIEIVLCD